MVTALTELLQLLHGYTCVARDELFAESFVAELPVEPSGLGMTGAPPSCMGTMTSCLYPPFEGPLT